MAMADTCRVVASTRGRVGVPSLYAGCDIALGQLPSPGLTALCTGKHVELQGSSKQRNAAT